MSVIGIGLTLLGIAWVISERVPGTDKKALGPGHKGCLARDFLSGNRGCAISRCAARSGR